MERFKDIKESFLSEVSEKKTFPNSNELYPEDLENLLYFLKSQCQGKAGSKII